MEHTSTDNNEPEQEPVTTTQRAILVVSVAVLLVLLGFWLWQLSQPDDGVRQWQSLNTRMINQAAQLNYSAAILAGRQALDLARELFPENDVRLAIAHDNLGEIIRRSGNFEDALPLLKAGLAIRRNLPGQPADALVTPLNNVACLYEDLFMFDEAETYFNEALSKAERHYGPEGRVTAIIMRNIARMYGKVIGKDQLAKEYSARADAVLGPLDEENLTPRF